jgi:hypothetical protein
VRTIKLLIRFGIRRDYLRNGRGRSLYLSIRRVIKKIVLIVEAHHFLPTMCNILSNLILSRLTPYAGNCWGSSEWISTQYMNY